jgi:hypothetical protein
MPDIDLSSHIKWLEEKVNELELKNQALLDLLLRQAHVLPMNEEIESTERVEFSNMQAIPGRVPWYKKKLELERHHKKPSLQEITGIEDAEGLKDAS